MKKATQLALGILTSVGGFFDVGNIATCTQAGAAFRFLLIWVFLWRSTFKTIENGTSLLGLITLCFVVAAIWHHPPVHEVLAGSLPSMPTQDPAKYWFIAVSIIGAVIAPYLFYFYSSGAVEDEWDRTYIPVNRAVAVIGMGCGSAISVGAIIVAAMVLAPGGIHVTDYHQAALVLTDAVPFWGHLRLPV